LFGGPLKNFWSERKTVPADGSDFQEGNSNLHRGTFKGLYPPTTPFGERNIITTVQCRIPRKKHFVNISKNGVVKIIF
jgi:hypothetical protein